MTDFEGTVYCPICGAGVSVNTVVKKVELESTFPWEKKEPALKVTFQDIRYAAHDCPNPNYGRVELKK